MGLFLWILFVHIKTKKRVGCTLPNGRQTKWNQTKTLEHQNRAACREFKKKRKSSGSQPWGGFISGKHNRQLDRLDIQRTEVLHAYTCRHVLPLQVQLSVAAAVVGCLSAPIRLTYSWRQQRYRQLSDGRQRRAAAGTFSLAPTTHIHLNQAGVGVLLLSKRAGKSSIWSTNVLSPTRRSPSRVRDHHQLQQGTPPPLALNKAVPWVISTPWEQKKVKNSRPSRFQGELIGCKSNQMEQNH